MPAKCLTFLFIRLTDSELQISREVERDKETKSVKSRQRQKGEENKEEGSVKYEQKRRERSFDVALAVLYDLAAAESAPLSCWYGPACARACQLEPMPAAPVCLLEKKGKKVGLGLNTLMFQVVPSCSEEDLAW